MPDWARQAWSWLSKRSGGLALLGLAGLGVVVVGLMLESALDISEGAESRWGPVGDYFGGITNPLLTFLTFLGLLYTIHQQRRELHDSRADAEKATAEVRKQTFEAAVFQMIGIHNGIVNDIEVIADNGDLIKGRACFRHMRRLLKTAFTQTEGGRNDDGEPYTPRERFLRAFEEFWERYEAYLSHYYRYLYNVFRFIDESEVNGHKYIRLIRAQLSDDELLLLFYDCVSLKGEKMKRYAEKYALFDNMVEERIFSRPHKEWIGSTAFGRATSPTAGGGGRA